VVRLSVMIRPTTFTMEHIPKTLSPTGSISSAPKDFAVYVSAQTLSLLGVPPDACRRSWWHPCHSGSSLLSLCPG
jgi:hypothetical protein